MSNEARMAELFGVVEELNDLHHEWLNSRGNEEGLPNRYWEAIDKLVDTFEHGDLPEACRGMGRIVDKIKAELHRIDGEGVDVSATRFHSLRDQLEAEYYKGEPQVKEIEPIKTLVEQNVHPKQIAQIYGFIDPSGKLRDDLVRQEYEKPGSVLGKLFPHPQDVARKRLEAFRAAREQYRHLRREEKPRPAAPAEKPAPETWQELFELDPPVSIEQLARMKCVSEEEVVRQARLHGKKHYLPAHEQKAEQKAEPESRAVESAEEESGDQEEEGSLDEQILSLAEEGLSTQEIRDQLGIDGRRVSAVLRKRAKAGV